MYKCRSVQLLSLPLKRYKVFLWRGLVSLQSTPMVILNFHNFLLESSVFEFPPQNSTFFHCELGRISGHQKIPINPWFFPYCITNVTLGGTFMSSRHISRSIYHLLLLIYSLIFIYEIQKGCAELCGIKRVKTPNIFIHMYICLLKLLSFYIKLFLHKASGRESC